MTYLFFRLLFLPFYVLIGIPYQILLWKLYVTPMRNCSISKLFCCYSPWTSGSCSSSFKPFLSLITSWPNLTMFSTRHPEPVHELVKSGLAANFCLIPHFPAENQMKPVLANSVVLSANPTQSHHEQDWLPQ